MAIDIDALKKRAAGVTPVIEVVAPVVKQMPAELRQQVEKFQEDLVKVNTPEEGERIDLGPLPEEARRKIEEQKKAATPVGAPVYKVFDQVLRAGVERRCPPMDFGDLVITNRVSQVVPILLKKITVEFQSLVGTETFWIERVSLLQPTEFRQAWMSYARLTMMLRALNGKVYESHLDTKGEVDSEIFDRKLATLLKMGDRVIELMLINMTWFNFRVEALFDDDFEALKNG